VGVFVTIEKMLDQRNYLAHHYFDSNVELCLLKDSDAAILLLQANYQAA